MARPHANLTLFSLTLSALSPAVASAAGFYISDVGAKGMGRAGAFVAAPDDLLAFAYNPAALTLLGPGPHVTFNLVDDSFSFSFKRSCPCVDPKLPNAAELDRSLSTRFIEGTNSAAPQLVPFAALAYQFPWMKLTVGAAGYAMTSPGRLKFGERDLAATTAQAQRYSLIDLDLFEAFYEAGIAIEPIQGLRIGAVAMLYEFHVTQSVNLWTNTSLNNDTSEPEGFENNDWDIPVVIAFDAPLRPCWAVGISYTPSFLPRLSVGASVMGKRASRAPGTAKITLPPVVADAVSVTGDVIEAEVNLPAIYRAGIEWNQPGLFEVEASVVVEAWSSYERVVIRGGSIQIQRLAGDPSSFGTVILPTGFTDTYSLRLGGELKMLEPYLSMRGGIFYEPSAVPNTAQDAAAPDLDKIGLALGLGTRWWGTSLDLGVNYVIYSERKVTNTGRALVLALPDGPTVMGTTTGNGTYTGSHLILGASVTVAVEDLLASLTADEPVKGPNTAPVPEPGPAPVLDEE